MHYQTLTLLAVTLTSVSASPVQLLKRDSQDYEVNADGNLNLIFSNEVVNLGTISADDILKKLDEVCSSGGQCDTGEFEFDGQLVAKGRNSDVQDITLTIEASGAYPTDLRDQLVNALTAAVKEVVKCEEYTHESDCAGVTAMAYCPPNTTKITACTMPRFWGINYQSPELGNAAPPHLAVDMKIEVEDGDFCGTFADIASALAGVVNPAAGAGFAVGKLLCGVEAT